MNNFREESIAGLMGLVLVFQGTKNNSHPGLTILTASQRNTHCAFNYVNDMNIGCQPSRSIFTCYSHNELKFLKF